MNRVPWALAALAALPALGLARLLPVEGAGVALRLAAATAVLLVPGAIVARALGQPGAAPAFVWSVAAVALGLGVTFVVHGGLWLAGGVAAAAAVVAFPFAVRRTSEIALPGTLPVLAAGVAFGVALWFVAPALGGDALFHLARVRKLEELGGLRLETLNEFVDGGLHPGYAFPAWHGFLALVARLAGVDPAAVVAHEPSILAPIAFLLAYEAGFRVFESAAGAVSALLAQVAIIGLAAGGGGAYTALALPPTAGRQLLVPAVIALVFAYVREPSRGLLAAAAAASALLALAHVTYAVFLCVPLAGYVVVRAFADRRELAHNVRALAAVAVPAGAVALLLRPLVSSAESFTPTDAERRRALEHYGGQLDVFSLERYRLSPELFSRTGAVAVAALLVVPAAALAWRRRWAALVLGGSLAVLALTLPSFVFPHVADLVSLSQARRLAGFLPLAFAFAGGALVAARFLGVLALPLALGGGIALQLAYPGGFDYGRAGGPAFPAWVALYGAAAGTVVAAVVRREVRLRRGLFAALASALFVLPVAVHGFANWSAAPADTRFDLTPGLVRVLRARVPERAVVFSDPDTSYRIAAYAPVYVAAAPTAHVADVHENRRRRRHREALRFFRTGDLSIPRRYGARWIVLKRARHKISLDLPVAYADARFVLYRL